jgi:hypothetical protein
MGGCIAAQSRPETLADDLTFSFLLACYGFPLWAQLQNLQQRGIGVQTCRKVQPDPTDKCTTRKPKAVRK